MITFNRDDLETGLPTRAMTEAAIKAHQAGNIRREKLKSYYQGYAKIRDKRRAQGLPNNRIAAQFPYYITTMAAGYMIGAPVKYESFSQKEALEAAMSQFKANNVDSVDMENATNASMMGLGVEVLYANEEAQPRVAAVSPLDTFVVYDDTVEHRPMFAVRRFKRGDDQYTDVYTDTMLIKSHGGPLGLETINSAEPHFFGGVPLIEYWNGADEMGDFERALDEIDAYNAVQSDRVNDKAQFTDAILVTRGIAELAAEMSDDYDQRTPGQRIKDEGMLMFPDKDADASYLTKQLSQGDNEVLLMAINRDIHKFSMVPDMTDANFAGNSSGVAMKYKLLGLEQLTKVKERWFREGLKQRLSLFAHFLQMKGGPALNAAKVHITFTHSLPVNELEEAQTVTTLRGLVSDEALLSKLGYLDS